jgi:peptidoglycan/LPS O-acetylase OafA/YrhL
MATAAPPHAVTTEEIGHLARRSGAAHYPLLEGLRAVAALAVFGYHLYLVMSPGAARSGGWTDDLATASGTAGVAVFFVLSGFLLYRPFSAAIHGGERGPSVAAYFQRRAARILPAYWIAFTVSALVIGLEGVTWGNSPIYLGLLQDYTDATRYRGISAAWSLSIEATFYILLPIGAVVLAALCRRSPSLEAVALIAVGLVPVALHLVRPGSPETILTHLDWFAVGMLLAALSCSAHAGRLHHSLQRRRVTALLWALAVLAYLVAARSSLITAELAFGAFAALVVASAASTHPRATARAVFGTRPLLWIGLVSYGVFLWHDPIVRRLDREGVGGLALVAVSLLLTLLVAAASYHLVEGPAQRWVRRRIAARA